MQLCLFKLFKLPSCSYWRFKDNPKIKTSKYQKWNRRIINWEKKHKEKIMEGLEISMKFLIHLKFMRVYKKIKSLKLILNYLNPILI